MISKKLLNININIIKKIYYIFYIQKMPQQICKVCHRKFKSEYLLNKHVNRKIPCNAQDKLICTKCNKVFKTYQDLQRHMNKKIPCAKDEKIISDEKISDKIKIIEAELKKEKDIILFKHVLEKEKIQLQKEKHLAIENAKLDRKVQTAQVINNIHNEIKIQQINNFVVCHPTEGVLDATPENLELPLDRFKFLITPHEAVKILYPPKSNSNLSVELISKLHGIEAPKEYRNFWYNSELDAFYKIMNNQWEYIKEEESIIGQIRHSLRYALTICKENVKHYTNTDDIFYENYANVQSLLVNKPDEYYRNIGTKGLSYESIQKTNISNIEYFSDSEEEYPYDPEFSRTMKALEAL
jgi:uncharacterized C2H2 Zn-finger protein